MHVVIRRRIHPVNRPSYRALCLALTAIATTACAKARPKVVSESALRPARYLFAWAGGDDRKDSEEEQRGCATPLVIGKYWIQSDAAGHRVFALDVRDLSRVRMISPVTLGARFAMARCSVGRMA